MPDYSFENEHGRREGRIICGVDEVGRGPLAGPVVSAAVILPPEGLPPEIEGLIADSKKLTPKKREALYPLLIKHCCYAIGECSVEEIDKLNILHASLLSMNRAITALAESAEHALIDGNKLPKDLPCSATPIVKGDDKSLSIAAASIIAKVTRDRFMAELAKTHPAYGWEKNAGYGTKIHMEGIEKFGITKWHRRSFAPVAKIAGK
ncbi:MAG: ribonuclease HII [Bdellovibrionales bacterium]